MSKIIALIPAYNEAERIAPVITATLAHLPVLVVDDGSSDDTAAIAEAAGAEVLRQTPNQGKGAAMRMGFRHALAAGCEAVITLDADGQHAPEEIPLFLDAYQQKRSDLIIGARDFSKMPFVRRNSNTIGRWMFSWAMGQSIPDNQSGYRLMSNRLLEAVLDSSEQGFEFEVEMIAVCVERGYKLDWVTISTIYAGETSHIQPLAHVRNYLRVVLATRRRMQGKG